MFSFISTFEIYILLLTAPVMKALQDQ